MAMITCTSCNKEVSSNTVRCPTCGIKIESPSFLKSLFSKKAKVSGAPNSSDAILLASDLVANWSYSSQLDSMSSKKIFFATVQSTNTVNFSFPYEGFQHATLQLRTHPQHGKDIILSVEQGQFLCDYDECSALIRFDESKPLRFNANEPNDNSTNYLFIRDYDGFVKRLLKAKKILIASEFYQNGTQTFEFDVTGFDNASYLPK